jgi:hypothetical protein
MKMIENTTDFIAALQRIKRQTEHAKGKRFVAAQIDIADLELLLRELGVE